MYEKKINGCNYWIKSMSKFGRSYYGVYTDNTELFGYDLIFVSADYDLCIDYINML
jgi:hypothetical protein